MYINKRIIRKINKIARFVKQNKNVNNLRLHDNLLLEGVLKTFDNFKNNNFVESEIVLFEKIERLRKNLLKDESIVSYEVFNDSEERMVKDICETSSCGSDWCRFLYKIVKNTRAKSCLEIGTCLGISGSYILGALKDVSGSRFITMEGEKKLCDLALKQFNEIDKTVNFEIIPGLYSETFPEIIKKDIKFDMIFFDGNHEKDATLNYFNLLKSKINNKAVFIFDDIYWSGGMRKAWRKIISDKDVNYSLDLWKLGVVIIDKQDPNKNISAKLWIF